MPVFRAPNFRSYSQRVWILLEVMFLQNLNERFMTKPTKWSVHPAKTLISLGIRPVWSEFLLCALWVAEDPRFLHAVCRYPGNSFGIPGWSWRLGHVTQGHLLHRYQSNLPLFIAVCWYQGRKFGQLYLPWRPGHVTQGHLLRKYQRISHCLLQSVGIREESSGNYTSHGGQVT